MNYQISFSNANKTCILIDFISKLAEPLFNISYFFICYASFCRQCSNSPQEAVDAIHATGAMVIFLPPYSPDFMPLEEVFTQVKNWIRENDAAWQFCQDPELMVEEAFLHVTDEEVKNYIHHAEYF